MKQRIVQRQSRNARQWGVALLAVMIVGTLLIPVASARPLRPVAAAAEPAQAPQQRIFLPMIRAGGTAQPQRSTRELIDAALAAGTITRETALLLKAQAVAGDPALPAAYRGSGTGDDGAAMMREVRVALPTLPADAQARLRPYLLPPSAPESWYARSVMGGRAQPASVQALAATSLTWQTINTANGKAKIWYHPEIAGDAARAQQIAGEIDGRIWNKLAGLFGRELPADCGTNCVEGGGDGRTDVYLLDRSLGWSGSGPSTGNVYTVLGRGATMSYFTWIFAWSWVDLFPVASEEEYAWLKAAASGYAVHYVYPDDNFEHPWAHQFFAQTWEPLNRQGMGAYLIFLYQQFHDADPQLVKRVLENAANPNSLAALDAALNGRLESTMAYFALFNINNSLVPMYEQDDQLLHGAWPRYDLQDQGLGKHPFPIAIPHLAADYYHFAFLDPAVRKVTFTNPIARDAVPGGHVWAMIIYQKADGTQDGYIEDWAQIARRTFCKDNPTENITNVTLIISNGNWKNRQTVMKTDNGIVEAQERCGGETDNTLQWSLVENTQTPGFERSVREQASVQVRLRYDAESGQYVDDGSTYSFSGSSSMSQIDANGVGFRGTGTNTGSGAIVASGGGIGAHIEDGSPRHFVLGIQLPYRHQGTMTYLPSGATETVSSEGVATLTCAEKPEYGDQLYGKETTEGSFSMGCTLSIARDGVTSRTTVSGTISISP